MDTLFSRRENLQAESAEVYIIDDAPYTFRNYLSLLICSIGLGLKEIRKIICLVVQESEDPNNWGENEFMKNEIQTIIENCPWYRIYDIIEYFYTNLRVNKAEYAKDINDYLIEKGIGWKFNNGFIETIGEEAFEQKNS